MKERSLGLRAEGLVRLVCVLLLMLGGRLCAQVVEVPSLGTSIDLAGGSWHYEQGDDARWKEPTFDDAGWRSVVPIDPVWTKFRCVGMCWYRIHVRLAPGTRGLSLGLNNVDTSYEVFVNGTPVGGHGRMPPHPTNYASNLTVYPIPDGAIGSGDVLIAVRVWASRLAIEGEAPGGMHEGSQVWLGPTPEIEVRRKADQALIVYGAVPRMISFGIVLLIGGAGLLLYRYQRDRLEYLWLFAMATCLGTVNLATVAAIGDLLPASVWSILLVVFTTGELICEVELAFSFVRRPVSRLFRGVQWFLVAFMVPLFLGVSRLIPPSVAQVAYAIWHLPTDFGVPALLFFAYRKRNKEAGLLMIPLLLLGLSNYVNVVWNLFALVLPQGTVARIPTLIMGPIAVNLAVVFNWATWLTLGLIMLNRSNAIVQERARISGELQAAKAVQDVLLPKLLVAPGFVLERAYFPAQEVGGDFFHISPGADGSLRVLIGDVSGKGVKAAMTVALIVGALDQEESRAPGAVLARLNKVLMQHSAGGFATCLCLMIAVDGVIVGANAGHFGPYKNGEELPVPDGLPLGLADEVSYPEVAWAMRTGDRLLMYSDGIPEARDAKGELFGFERTGALIASAGSAAEVAAAAQAYGQDDDITVLQVERVLASA